MQMRILAGTLLAMWAGHAYAAGSGYDERPAVCVAQSDFTQKQTSEGWAQFQTVRNDCTQEVEVFVYTDTGSEFSWLIPAGGQHTFECRGDGKEKSCTAWSPEIKTKSQPAAGKETGADQAVAPQPTDEKSSADISAQIEQLEQEYSTVCADPDSDSNKQMMCDTMRHGIDEMKTGNEN